MNRQETSYFGNRNTSVYNKITNPYKHVTKIFQNNIVHRQANFKN